MQTQKDRAAYKKEWARRNRARIRRQKRAYYQANKSRLDAKAKAWVENNPSGRKKILRRYAVKKRIEIQQRTKNWAENNPRKVLAHKALNHAIERGEIRKPSRCSNCKKKRKLDGHHHKGYAPRYHLDVKWLCRKCHKSVDKK